jgi:hypothetical protein
LFDTIGRQSPPPITHPDFYYGFVGVTLAWQFAFAVMASDPVRFRPLMLPAVLEKFTFVGALAVLFLQNRVAANQLIFGGIDMVLGILFLVSFAKTRAGAPAGATAR